MEIYFYKIREIDLFNFTSFFLIFWPTVEWRTWIEQRNLTFIFISESPQWLESFCNKFTDWSGLSLDAEENKRLRTCIIQKTPSILDVRNYLFARQSQLLLNLNRPWEVSMCTIYLIEQYVCYYVLLLKINSMVIWIFLLTLPSIINKSLLSAVDAF